MLDANMLQSRYCHNLRYFRRDIMIMLLFTWKNAIFTVFLLIHICGSYFGYHALLVTF